MRKTVRARTPDDHHALKLRKPKNKAAGIPAVTSSSLHGLSKMGVIKTIKTLSMVNQKEGLTAPDVRGLIPNIAPRSNFVKTGQKPSLTKP